MHILKIQINVNHLVKTLTKKQNIPKPRNDQLVDTILA